MANEDVIYEEDEDFKNAHILSMNYIKVKSMYNGMNDLMTNMDMMGHTDIPNFNESIHKMCANEYKKLKKFYFLTSKTKKLNIFNLEKYKSIPTQEREYKIFSILDLLTAEPEKEGPYIMVPLTAFTDTINHIIESQQRFKLTTVKNLSSVFLRYYTEFHLQEINIQKLNDIKDKYEEDRLHIICDKIEKCIKNIQILDTALFHSKRDLIDFEDFCKLIIE